MTREAVSSTNVRSIGYDDGAQILEVEFATGVYRYENVPRSVYDQLMAAESKGKFLIAHVKKAFASSKVAPLPVGGGTPADSAALTAPNAVLAPDGSTPRI